MALSSDKESSEARGASLARWASFALLAVYFYFFARSISGLYPSAGVVNDDGLQQLFPFHAVLEPAAFAGDPTYEAMRGYLMPLHWQLGALFTRLTGDPVMAGHCLALIQFAVLFVFLWLAARRAGNVVLANLSAVWLLHTRPFIGRMASGLPRGWFGTVSAAYLYARIRGSEPLTLGVIATAALLNPPAALLAGCAYALELLWRARSEFRLPAFRRAALRFLALGVLLAGVLAVTTHRPASIGRMVTLKEARRLPEFQRGSGRFKLLPFRSPLETAANDGLRVFFTENRRLRPLPKSGVVLVLLLGAAALGAAALKQRRNPLPRGCAAFFCASIAVYFLARILAFRLYIPDRYILAPWSVWLALVVPLVIWRVLNRRTAYLSLAVLAALVVYCGKAGLRGPCGLTTHRPVPDFYRELARLTPPGTLFAGNPDVLSPLPLFSARRMLVTSEVAHPFYRKYYEEMERRLKVTWQAVYATSASEFARALQAEGVRYFIFRKHDYAPEKLRNPQTFMPIGSFVADLVRAHRGKFVYRAILADRSPEYVLYRDKRVLIVDVARFQERWSR